MEKNKMIKTRREPGKAFIACVLVFSLTACSTGRPKNQWQDLGPHQVSETKISPSTTRWGADMEPNARDPQIAPGYLVALRCPDDNKLNGEFRVEFDGTLSLPYEMSVNTNGMTLSQLERRLNEMYKPYFKTSNGIKARVQEKRYWVDVRGLLDKPGRYLVEHNTSLDQVATMAGGYLRDMPARYVRIQKGSRSMVLDLNQVMTKTDDKPQIASWLGGETLYFQKDILAASTSGSSRLPVYVMGAVQKPGEYSTKPGNDFVDLVTQADGFTEAADLGRIEIIRRTGGRQAAYEFQWNDFAKAPPLQEGDVVYIHADHETRTERRVLIGIGILTAFATIATAVVLAKDLNRINNR
jgi:protein involved in polysaccharide export with SLBB domain